MVVTFSLVLGVLNGCGKGSKDLANRDTMAATAYQNGTTAVTAYQNHYEDIKTGDLQGRNGREYGQMRLYNLRNTQPNLKDTKHFPVVLSTVDGKKNSTTNTDLSTTCYYQLKD
jgi:hypothetical protein